MRFLDPGAGEITDRLTILALKILFGREAGKEVTHFEAERTSLLAKIRSKTLNGAWFDRVLDLAAVNAALWHCEDEMREWRQLWAPTGPDSTALRGPGEGYKAATALEVVDCAFRIQSLNDQRANLVREINKDAGDSVGQEKL
jgi:predicted mannosyl-3-phosphoglycerate phosphatase (HAD superfamily)